MRIVMADAGLPFDGLTPIERPLGGAESAFVALASQLAKFGAQVIAYSRDAREYTEHNVIWRPLGAPWPTSCDIYIANRDPSLIARGPQSRQKAFWLHNPANFLSKPRYWVPILRAKPTLVFSGEYHLKTAPAWPPARRVVIPLGVEPPFLNTPRSENPPPARAVFLSNPTRGLSPLLSLWEERIRPGARGATFDLYCGPNVYGAQGDKASAMLAVLDIARATPGVVVRDPVTKDVLARVLADARALLYLGDPNETFCLAVAEAQAMGVPAIVRPVGSLPERVQHGETGFVAETPDAFAEAATRILTDDVLWRRLSQRALMSRADAGWEGAARAFLRLAEAAGKSAE